MVSSNQSLFPHSLAHVQDSGSHVRYLHTKSKTLLENNEVRGISGAPWARQPLSTAAAAWPCQAQVTVPNLPFWDKASENGLVAPPGLRRSLPPKATDFTPEFSEQFLHLEALESPIFLYPSPPNPNVDSSPTKMSMPFSSPLLRPKCHASPTRCPRRPPRSPHAAEHPATAVGCRLGRTLSSDHGLTTKRKSNARRERGGACTLRIPHGRDGLFPFLLKTNSRRPFGQPCASLRIASSECEGGRGGMLCVLWTPAP